MSHRPTIIWLHVEARILLTTVAGRSSMDRMAQGIEHMVIETLLFIHARRHRRGRRRESLRVAP